MATILVVLLGGCSSEPSGTSQTLEPTRAISPTVVETPVSSAPPVAKVGPYLISLNDVLRLTSEKEKAAHQVSEATPVTTVRKNIRKAYLDEMVTRRLLILGALKHPEWIADASCEREVQRQLTVLGPDEIERRRKLAGVAKDDFLDQFRRFIREEMMKREILRREVEEQGTVTIEEIHQRFDRDLEKIYHRPDSWGVYHIDLYLPREQAAGLPALREKLEGIRSQAANLIQSATDLQDKADLFSPLVQDHSQAPDAKTGYAYIYDTLDVKFDPEFVKRVKTSTPGELSPVFELAGDDKKVGVCFFLAFEKKPGVYTSFDRAKNIIQADLIKEKKDSLRKALLERLRNEYKVEIWEDRLFQGIETTAGG